MPEHVFMAEVCRQAECKALLDVNNVYVKARNHDIDASAFIAETPADIIGENHLAGHAVNLFDDGQKARLFSNIAEAMQGVPEEIIERQLGHFEKVHPDYAAGVRAALSEKAKKA